MRQANTVITREDIFVSPGLLLNGPRIGQIDYVSLGFLRVVLDPIGICFNAVKQRSIRCYGILLIAVVDTRSDHDAHSHNRHKAQPHAVNAGC
jgi:hypothetical protein